MTVYDDNPAGRLHKLITSFLRSASNHKVFIAWAAALGMPPEPLPGLLMRLSWVYALPTDIDAEIAKLSSDADYDPDAVMRWRFPIGSAFSTSIFSDQESKALASHFDDASMLSLEWCSDVLHRYRPQPGVPESDLKRIRQLITDLRDEINSDDGIEPELKDFLLYHANSMERALGDLAVRGRVALEDAFDQAYGAVNRRTDLTARIDEKRSVWEKWGNLMLAVATVLQIAVLSLSLPGQIRDAIEGPAPQPSVTVKVIEQPGSGTGTAQVLPAGASSATNGGEQTSSP